MKKIFIFFFIILSAQVAFAKTQYDFFGYKVTVSKTHQEDGKIIIDKADLYIDKGLSKKKIPLYDFTVEDQSVNEYISVDNPKDKIWCSIGTWKFYVYGVKPTQEGLLLAGTFNSEGKKTKKTGREMYLSDDMVTYLSGNVNYIVEAGDILVRKDGSIDLTDMKKGVCHVVSRGSIQSFCFYSEKWDFIKINNNGKDDYEIFSNDVMVLSTNGLNSIQYQTDSVKFGSDIRTLQYILSTKNDFTTANNFTIHAEKIKVADRGFTIEGTFYKNGFKKPVRAKSPMFYDIKSGCIIIDDPDVEFDINMDGFAAHIKGIKAQEEKFYIVRNAICQTWDGPVLFKDVKLKKYSDGDKEEIIYPNGNSGYYTEQDESTIIPDSPYYISSARLSRENPFFSYSSYTVISYTLNFKEINFLGEKITGAEYADIKMYDNEDGNAESRHKTTTIRKGKTEFILSDFSRWETDEDGTTYLTCTCKLNLPTGSIVPQTSDETFYPTVTEDGHVIMSMQSMSKFMDQKWTDFRFYGDEKDFHIRARFWKSRTYQSKLDDFLIKDLNMNYDGTVLSEEYNFSPSVSLGMENHPDVLTFEQKPRIQFNGEDFVFYFDEAYFDPYYKSESDKYVSNPVKYKGIRYYLFSDEYDFSNAKPLVSEDAK